MPDTEDANPSPRFALWLPVGVLWLIGGIPVGVWAGMFVHAIRAWRFLGRWPAPNNPDPKALPPALQSERIEAWIIGVVVSLVISIGIQSTMRSNWKVRFIAAGVGVVVLWASWIAIAHVDPGRVVEWYLG